LRNRLYRAPVLEGAGDGDDAVETYTRAFVPNAEAGVGLIIQGNSIITAEGRTSPGMTIVDRREKVLRLEPMVSAVHRAGAAICIQIGHGGLYAMEAWHEPYRTMATEPLLVPSPLRLPLRAAFMGTRMKVLSTDDVHALCRRFGDVAAWCREAGYDAVQLASANAKLLDQFLSPFYNRRDDEFGGSVERRAAILRHIRAAISERAGADFPVLVKIPFETRPPFGPHVTVEDGVRLAHLAVEFGYDAVTPVEVSVFPDLTLSRGAAPDNLRDNEGMRRRFEAAAPSRLRRAVLTAGYRRGPKQAPFVPVWNRDVFSRVRASLHAAGTPVPVLGVGGIRTRAEADEVLAAGDADLIGVGRPFYAEPDLPARFFAADPHSAACRSSNLCVPAQMLGMKGACYNREVVAEVRARR
jgi:2,4-dienoyl-CoA reductase-like NADH-dependent reductase (Old Yellow Enzyme family)